MIPQWRIQGGGGRGDHPPPLVAENVVCSNSNFSPTGAITPPPPLQKIPYPRLYRFHVQTGLMIPVAKQHCLQPRVALFTSAILKIAPKIWRLVRPSQFRAEGPSRRGCSEWSVRACHACRIISPGAVEVALRVQLDSIDSNSIRFQGRPWQGLTYEARDSPPWTASEYKYRKKTILRGQTRLSPPPLTRSTCTALPPLLPLLGWQRFY